MPLVPDLVCLSTADWDAALWTNKQHLMSRLSSAGVSVIYIDSPGHRSPSVNRGDLHRVAHRVRVWRPHASPIGPHLWRDSPLVIPFNGHPLAARVNKQLLRSRLRRNIRRTKVHKPVLWAYSPLAIDLYNPDEHSALIYHCVDRVASFPGVHRASFLAAERRLVETADVCLASSRVLEASLWQMGARQVQYWPNPADVAAICRHKPERRPHERPRVGFLGAVQSHKVDVELLKYAAAELPSVDFVIAGPINYGISGHRVDPKDFPTNVNFPGLVKRNDVPAFLAQLDVGIIPYLINDYTTGVFPMKVYEFLAAGLPVVSTALPSLIGDVREISYVRTPTAFVESVRSALADQDEPSRQRRVAYAQTHSWEHRVDEAISLLQRFALPNALAASQRRPPPSTQAGSTHERQHA